ncbi:hypothetical protein BDF20DRAFT_253308 [Mycotypha africana]|uniref:uncharacterized protein n=1 Tax=Mycotypha africana TaxID=64632 RepID=UPI0023009F47|nr:uncharacterized protein BDF20DRAFT_253308 [Mycotypha africana]KAI8987245.1 hypothetical protein BDF20DRAFT_253308 [Mycotypha africana]
MVLRLSSLSLTIMLTLLKKPCLNGLPGTTVLTDEIRKELNINEKLLKLDAKQWSETKALVDDYFENHQLDFQSIGKNVLRSILEVLLTISNYKYIEGNRHLIAQPLQEYSYKVYKYLRQTHLQEEFERFFKLKEVEARKNLQELYAEKEGEVVEHALERRTLVRIGKRTEREIDAEKENIAPVSRIVNTKIYQ